MNFIGRFRRLTAVQRNTFLACFLGWSLDAFDCFILVFCLNALAVEFHVKVSEVSEGIFWTLAMRPVGAFLFGMMADRFGRPVDRPLGHCAGRRRSRRGLGHHAELLQQPQHGRRRSCG